MGSFGLSEILLIGIIAILIYGKDLPQVARKAARLYGQARRYMANVRDEISRQIPEEDLDISRHINEAVEKAEEKTSSGEPEEDSSDGRPEQTGGDGSGEEGEEEEEMDWPPIVRPESVPRHSDKGAEELSG